jgi:hypothetical protein
MAAFRIRLSMCPYVRQARLIASRKACSSELLIDQEWVTKTIWVDSHIALDGEQSIGMLLQKIDELSRSRSGDCHDDYI